MDLFVNALENYPILSGGLFLMLTIATIYYNIFEIKSTEKENKEGRYFASVFKGWVIAFVFLMFSFYCFCKS